MSFLRYERYKDSGVEWLGEVPEHWQIKRVKHIKSHENNAFVDGPFGSNLKSDHFVVDGSVYVIESNFATTKSIDADKLKTITLEHFETIRRSEAKKDDIVIAKIGARFGMASILPKLDKPSVISGNSLKLTVNKTICSTKWSLLQLENLKSSGEIDLLVNGSAQPALSLAGMNTLPFLLPPNCEQIKITQFLDHETARIDALIAEQERLIALLKEKRQAVISHAVTKGLDPTVPMKDSGVEWLGEVPEHWNILQIRRLFNIKKSIAGKLGYDVLSITQKGVKKKDIHSGDGQLASDYSKYQLVEPGDFAMNHMDLLTGYVDISKFYGVTSPDYRVFKLEKSTDHDSNFFLRIFVTTQA